MIGEKPLQGLTDDRYGATVGVNLFELLYENELQRNPWRFSMKKAALSRLLDTPLNQYHVVMGAAPEFLQSPESLHDLHVSVPGGAQVPLALFARYETTEAPLVVNHHSLFVASTISFNPAPGVSLSQQRGRSTRRSRASASRPRCAAAIRARRARSAPRWRTSRCSFLPRWPRSTSCWVCSTRASSTRSRFCRRCRRRASVRSPR